MWVRLRACQVGGILEGFIAQWPARLGQEEEQEGGAEGKEEARGRAEGSYLQPRFRALRIEGQAPVPLGTARATAVVGL